MNDGFEPIEEYNGDIILIEKLHEFIPSECWEWNEGEEISLDDISIAIIEAIPEISEPYGDTWNHPVLEHKARE